MLLIDRSLTRSPGGTGNHPRRDPEGSVVFCLRRGPAAAPAGASGDGCARVRPTLSSDACPGAGPHQRRSARPRSGRRVRSFVRRETTSTATPRGTVRVRRLGAGHRRRRHPRPSRRRPACADGGSDGRRLRLPPGIGQPEPPAATRARRPSRPSLSQTLRISTRRLPEADPRGTGSGTGQQMGPLVLRPRGARLHRLARPVQERDLPELDDPPGGASSASGARGPRVHGASGTAASPASSSSKSVGTPALDRAAANAILAGWLPAPAVRLRRHASPSQVSLLLRRGAPG